MKITLILPEQQLVVFSKTKAVVFSTEFVFHVSMNAKPKVHINMSGDCAWLDLKIF